MQAFFDRLAAVPLLAKIGGLLGLVALLCGGYWYFFYSDLEAEYDDLVKQGENLTKEKKEYEKRKTEYLAFRNEVNALLDEQKELLRVLPKSDDIEQFIENVQAQVELAGLSKVSSVRDPAMPVEMYVKIPIKMSVVGSYHQINHFFKNVGELKRIVNLEDLAMVPASAADNAGSASQLLSAKFTATTFMFQDKGRPPPGGVQHKPTGTSITSGGAK